MAGEAGVRKGKVAVVGLDLALAPLQRSEQVALGLKKKVLNKTIKIKWRSRLL